MIAWLPDVERIDSPWSGGTYLTGVPWRFVAHTTEVVPSSLAGAKAMAARHPHPPHLWAWPQRGWLGQTVPLDRSAAALVQPPGVPASHRTNKARAIQVEIIGHAAETPTWPKDWWEWLGSAVLAPVVAAGYPINLGRIANLLPYPPSYGQTTARMGWSTWLAFDGLCAHLNVPGNLHGDIGAGRLDLMAAAAKAELHPPAPPKPKPPPPADLEVHVQPYRFYRFDGDDEVWLVPADHASRHHVPSQAALVGHRQALFLEMAAAGAKGWSGDVVVVKADDPVGVMLASLPVQG